MVSELVTITLPATRKDGSPFTAADYGGAHIFRSDDGGSFNKLATVAAPALTFLDVGVAPGKHQYEATVFDVQIPPVESAASAPVEADVAAPLAAPDAPTVTVAPQ